jgi:hypothetical protein
LLPRNLLLRSGKEISTKRRESTWMFRLKSRMFCMILMPRRRLFLKENRESLSLEGNLRMPKDRELNLKVNLQS